MNAVLKKLQKKKSKFIILFYFKCMWNFNKIFKIYIFKCQLLKCYVLKTIYSYKNNMIWKEMLNI